ncbi:STAS domain-containing protein [Chromobacterium aquaticum]|uniref:STAS domain-containing protein n=1 Tax=Chromobacterium aquaticum TaxID=467180 RepID=A0ABV8ZP16_9NEIS|nr:STAS domain-containing protein [Chromobacterium aquaticum]MCD5360190.1 STAS domain-containing protein [Chromobacterium aquaticum]
MLEHTAPGRARLSGQLNMDSCGALAAPLAKLAGEAPLRLDLSGITSADSAALALLLGARRAADAAGHALALENWPSGLSALLDLYSLAELLSATAAD